MGCDPWPCASGSLCNYDQQMTSVVITLIGDDQAGLVDAVASVVAKHHGNWDRSHLAELAGKFAGIVLVEVPEEFAEAMLVDLQAIDEQGLLAIVAERAVASGFDDTATHVALVLTGQDHAGIVHEVSRVLAQLNVSIDQLETAIEPAPQGGNLFVANAVLELPAGLATDQLSDALESVAHDLMVDLDIVLD